MQALRTLKFIGGMLVLAMLALSLSLSGVGAQGEIPQSTFTTEDGSFAVDYPETLVAQFNEETQEVIIASNETALTAVGQTAAGEIRIAIALPGTSPDLPEAFRISGQPAPEGPPEVLAAIFAQNQGVIGYSPQAIPVDLAGKPTIFVEFEDPNIVGIYVVMDVGNGDYCIITVLTAPGEEGTQRQNVLSILSTIRYTPSGAQETTPEAPTPATTEEPAASPEPTEAATEVATEIPTEAPTEVPTEAATEAATETPTPEVTEPPTPAPVDPQSLTLVPSQFISRDGTFQFNHPTGWTVGVEGNVLEVVAPPADLTALGFQSSALVLNLGFIAASDLSAPSSDPVTFLSVLSVDFAADAQLPLSFEPAQPVTVGGGGAATIRGTAQGENLVDLWIGAFAYAPDSYVVMTVLTAQGDLDKVQPIVAAMFDSIRYSGAQSQVQDGVYRAADGNISFVYPPEWTLTDHLGFVQLEPETLPTEPFWRIGLYLPATDDADFSAIYQTATSSRDFLEQILAALADDDEITITNTGEIQDITLAGKFGTQVQVAFTGAEGNIESAVIVMQVAEGLFIPVVLVAEAPLQAQYLDTLNVVAGSLTFGQPIVATTPTATPSPDAAQTATPTEATPAETGTPEATAAVTETPAGVTETPTETTPLPETPTLPSIADREPTTAGRIGLLYADGTLTVYNASNEVLDLGDLAFVLPDGSKRFVADHFGDLMRTQFYPGRCVRVYLFSQPYVLPKFCTQGLTRELAYLFGTEDHLYWVWDPRFNAAGVFQVVRNDETIAQCTISAGECAFDVPLARLPIIPEWP